MPHSRYWTRSAPHQADELPPCEGPKLRAFDSGQTPIVWHERLGVDPIGSQGYVYRAQIGSQVYAIKIFKFFDPFPLYCEMRLYLECDINLELLRWHADPFFAECRAYGRIQEIEAKTPGKRMAAQCFGFIESSENDQRLSNFVQSQGLDLEYPHDYAGPVRAIVKEYIQGDVVGVPRTKFGARTLLGNIRALNRLGIYNGDIRTANIKEGVLLDFGLARTEPCIFHDCLPPAEIDGMKHQDLVLFDEMVEEEGIQTKTIALPSRNHVYCRKLRSAGSSVATLEETEVLTA